jgi:hypothetical protein
LSSLRRPQNLINCVWKPKKNKSKLEWQNNPSLNNSLKPASSFRRLSSTLCHLPSVISAVSAFSAVNKYSHFNGQPGGQ